MDNIDDLFGDGDNEDLNAALAATLDSDTLRRRVEEAHRIGCCRRLAWSRTGSVAHIPRGGREITIRSLVRDRTTGKSTLTDGTYKPVQADGDTCFTHIEWSMLGSELVATDQFGRLYVYSMTLALNRLLPNKLSYTVPQDDLSAVVGIRWLSTTSGPQRVPLIAPSTKDGNRWHTSMSPYQYQHITHPFEGRSAFLCVTRNNHVKLIYQQPSQPWQETTMELGELSSSGDLLTHASFGEAQGQLLLVTYDASNCLRLYRVHILWNQVQGDPQHGQPPSVNPTLRVAHTQLLDHVLPQSASGAELSQLYIQPATIGAENGHVQITALFTCLPDDQQMGHGANSRGSVVARWELKAAAVVLHEVFKTLKPGTDKLMPSKPRETLHRLEDTFVPKVYLSMDDNLYHSVFAFTSSDGTVDFRNRATMEVIAPDGDSNRVSSLPQAGFSYMTSECTDMALSPSGCVSAIVKDDDSVHIHVADYVHGWTDAKADHFQPQAAVVALAREVAILFCHNLGSDDIVALLPPHLDRGLRRRFIAELLRTLSKNTDYSIDDAANKDKAKVLKDNFLFKILSMQMILAYGEYPVRRDVPGKLAWAMLNLRSLASNIMATITMSSSPSHSHQTPDAMISSRGLVRWHFDLMHMVFNDLFTIFRAATSASSSESSSTVTITREFIMQQIAANGDTPSIHILLHSALRHLLRFLAEIEKLYFQRAGSCKQLARDLAQRAAIADIEGLLTSHLAFKLPLFEQLLLEIDGAVRKAYTEAGVDARGRSIAEQSMLVEGDIPEVLVSVLQGLFEKQLPQMMERVDGVKIFTTETSWLGFGGSASATADDEEQRRAKKTGRVVDIIRKVEVPLKGLSTDGKKHGLRTCRRCGSHVEDLWEDRTLLPWVMSSQRACICLSPWVV
ncbi:hypothetical protein AAFC00_005461 [Neodothiora populina]